MTIMLTMCVLFMSDVEFAPPPATAAGVHRVSVGHVRTTVRLVGVGLL